MRKLMIIGMLFLTLPLWAEETSEMLKDFCYDEADEDYAFQINGNVVSMDSFLESFAILTNSLTEDEIAEFDSIDDLYDYFVESQISSYCLFQKGLDEGIFDDDFVKYYIRVALIQTLNEYAYEYYFSLEDESAFEATDEEVSEFYEENWQYYTGYGYSSDEIRELIAYQMLIYNQQIWMQELLSTALEEVSVKRSSELSD